MADRTIDQHATCREALAAIEQAERLLEHACAKLSNLPARFAVQWEQLCLLEEQVHTAWHNLELEPLARDLGLVDDPEPLNP